MRRETWAVIAFAAVLALLAAVRGPLETLDLVAGLAGWLVVDIVRALAARGRASRRTDRPPA